MPASLLRSQFGALFAAAVEAVHPAQLIQRTVTVKGAAVEVRLGDQTATFPLGGPVFLIGAGKGAGSMAQALAAVLEERLAGGVVVIPQGQEGPRAPVTIVRGEHPLPGQGSLRGGQQIAKLLARRRSSGIVFCCLTGGASSLLVSPVSGVSLADKVKVNRHLLESGADIQAINTVRKHVSQVKGGGLARWAHPATLVSFILSDVVGDDLGTIGSGPTVPDHSTFQDAWQVLEQYQLRNRVPHSVLTHLRQGCAGAVAETPKPGDEVFASVHNFLVGSNRLALNAAATAARRIGMTPHVLPTPLNGDTASCARVFADQLRILLQSCRIPTCVLAGGETTVRVTGRGKGGRNQEFALVVAQALQNVSGWALLSAGTDGIDGPTDAAGAFVDGQSVQRAQAKGLDPQAFLRDNDTYSFLSVLEDLFLPGPTGTNVMDLKIAFLFPPDHPFGQAGRSSVS